MFSLITKENSLMEISTNVPQKTSQALYNSTIGRGNREKRQFHVGMGRSWQGGSYLKVYV